MSTTPRAFTEYDACCVSPFMLRAPINKTYNLHNILQKAASHSLVYSSCSISCSVFSCFILFFIIYVPVGNAPSLSFPVVSHWTQPKRRNSYSSQEGEIFWVSAPVPANDKDYCGDLPLPLWWIMLQHAFMSLQRKWKNGTSLCFDNLETHC